MNGGAHLPIVDEEALVRPKTRGECVDGPRPCPFVSCAHHLYWDINKLSLSKATSDIEDPDIDELAASCSLDVADEGGVSSYRVAAELRLTSARIQQIERRALRRVGDTVRLRKGAVALLDWANGKNPMFSLDPRVARAEHAVADVDDADDEEDAREAEETTQGSIWNLALDETRERVSAAMTTVFRAYICDSIRNGLDETHGVGEAMASDG